MPAIRILPPYTVNRIAAGEVIERPAAAVKELVENALDAGAGRISVALHAGGIDGIEVTDDGFGMDPRVWRCPSCVTPHPSFPTRTLSTSRPWAFAARRSPRSAPPRVSPSRRARARRSMPGRSRWKAAPSPTSRQRRAPLAPASWSATCSLPHPARRKFLKHPRTEADHAEAAVRRLALAVPAVAFRLESDGRTLFDLPSQDRADRVAALFGAEAAEAMVEVAGERGPLRVAGYACSPAVTRATAAAQALTVNGRPVADPVLRGAVRIAYREVIAFGRHPVVALWLDLPADEVDVNVHPTKAELRYRDVGAVRSLLIGSVGRALAGGAGAALPGPRPSLSLVRSRSLPVPYRAVPLPGMAETQLAFGAAPAARMLPPVEPDCDHPLGAPIARVLDTYVIAVAADGSLVLVDQHAAHERLTHEQLREQMLDGGVRTQPLLLPAVVDLPPADASRLLARASELALLGLEIEAFGPGAVMVRALPAALGAPEPGPLLRDLADELEELDEATALNARLDAVIARLACHGSIRAGRRLNAAEMGALLRQMEATPRAATCSHGRPTFLKLSKAEIEKLFGRR